MKTSTPVKREREAYHHGNLREELIRCGRQLLIEQGINKFSLRSVTRMVGVSHGAPRNEFADKEGLLAAIAAEGLRELTQFRMKRFKPGMSAETRLTHVVDGYIEFAVQQPQIFYLMFGPQIEDKERYPDLIQEVNASYQLLYGAVRDYLVEAGYPGQFNENMVRNAWSAAHGVSMLFSNKPGGPKVKGRAPLDTWKKSVIQFVLDGLLCEARKLAGLKD
jgi:AcrR family transcriptional regulator